MSKPGLNIVKIGGALIEDHHKLQTFIEEFLKIPSPKILIHGGGVMATTLSKRLGIEVRMIDGRRITDVESLKVAVMVYAGWINKNLVSFLQSKGANALGLTGADGNLIESVKRPVKEIDYGYVGDIQRVNSSFIVKLLDEQMIPVIAPITHSALGELLNTNADTIASSVASSLADNYTVDLYYCFGPKGVLRDKSDASSVIDRINPIRFEELINDEVVDSGMIPKLNNGFNALKGGANKVFIGDISGISSREGITQLNL